MTSSSGPLMPLNRAPLSVQIAEHLRNEIIRGLIPAGTRLVQEDICTRFGTSRMPVRDALQQLTHEGLLTDVDGRREVVSLGRDELADAHALTAVLHGWAARLAAERWRPEGLAELERCLKRAVNETDSFEFGRWGLDFHRTINHLANSPRLLKAIAREQTTIPRLYPLSFPDEMPQIQRAYTALFEAIRSRDLDESERRGRQVALDLANLMVGLLGETSPDGPDSPTN